MLMQFMEMNLCLPGQVLVLQAIIEFSKFDPRGGGRTAPQKVVKITKVMYHFDSLG